MARARMLSSRANRVRDGPGEQNLFARHFVRQFPVRHSSGSAGTQKMGGGKAHEFYKSEKDLSCGYGRRQETDQISAEEADGHMYRGGSDRAHPAGSRYELF